MIRYERDGLLQFAGDSRFGEALGFNRLRPDLLAVAAFDAQSIMGMAGANEDCETIWQIGSDVLPGYRGGASGGI